MQDPSIVVQEQLVYRRILGRDWKLRNNLYQVEAAAFIPKPGTSLSVFLAARVPSRRYVLQDHVNKKLQRLDQPGVTEAEKLKIQRQREAGLLTVEALYRDGWRIVALPISIIPADVFQFEPPDGEDDGHLNIIGSDEAFETYADRWASQTRILTEAGCLQG